MTYEIQFTEGEKRMATWTGYTSKSEARRDIREADMMIPLTWEYTIVEATIRNEDYISIEESLIDYEDE